VRALPGDNRRVGLPAWAVVVGLGLIAADQVTKFLAQRFLSGSVLHLIDSVLVLRLVRNEGIAFGLVTTLVLPLSVLAALVLLLVAGTAWTKLAGSCGGLLGVVMVASGAVSNLADRLRLGCVVDFVDLGWWPVFNLADVWLVAGCVVILITQLRRPRTAGAGL
jgi:signal peptidase II